MTSILNEPLTYKWLKYVSTYVSTRSRRPYLVGERDCFLKILCFTLTLAVTYCDLQSHTGGHCHSVTNCDYSLLWSILL